MGWFNPPTPMMLRFWILMDSRLEKEEKNMQQKSILPPCIIVMFLSRKRVVKAVRKK